MWVGVSLDQMSGDVERPYELFGNLAPEEVDSVVDSTIVSAWVERGVRAAGSKNALVKIWMIAF